MIDQERWENVINALELCTSEIETRIQVPCEKCHYHNKEYHGVHGNGCCNMRSLQCDILALLKAQEPRVMTLEEVIESAVGDVVWLEDVDKSTVIAGLVDRVFTGTRVVDFQLVVRTVTANFDDYGERWRCWTSRPTDEVRRTTPWN